MPSLSGRLAGRSREDPRGVAVSGSDAEDEVGKELHHSRKSLVAASVDTRVHTWLAHRHFLHQGHTGRVLCLGADSGVDNIITGGEDGTARVWRFDAQHSQAYRLFVHTSHDCPVTAVAISSAGAVMAIGTEEGDVFLLGGARKGDKELECLTKLHSGAVNDLCMLSTVQTKSMWESEAQGESELSPRDTDYQKLASVGTDWTVRVLKIFGREPPFRVTERCVLVHDSDVFSVRSVHVEKLGPALDLATCARDAVYLWNDQGELLTKLSSSVAGGNDGQHISGFAISFDGFADPGQAAVQRADETLLVASGHGLVSVWQLDFIDGQLREAPDASLSPLVQYEWAAVRDIELSPDNKYLVEMRHTDCNLSNRICIWGLEPKEEKKLRHIEPGPDGAAELVASDFVAAGEELFESAIFLESPVSVARMVFDPDEEGATLVTGALDGSVGLWDLSGHDAGEMSASLRSLTFLELAMPVVLLVISFAQVVSFAFGPAVPWNAEIHARARIVVAVTVLDWPVVFKFDKALIFWPKTFATLGVMLAYTLSAIFSLPNRLYHLTCVLDERPCLLWPCRLAYGVASFLMWSCSSILVVPISRACAAAVDCVHPPDTTPFVASAPSIECFVGPHIWLVRVLAIAYPLFFTLLLPYATVQGDTHYVQPRELLSWSAWNKNSMRKSTILHIGPMHPVGGHAFSSSVLGVVAKVALPVVGELTTSRPVLQMCLVTTIGLAMLTCTLVWRPLVEDSFNVVVVGMRVFTVFAMACGLASAVVDDPERMETTMVFACGSAVIALATVWGACRAPKMADHLHVHLFSSVDARPVALRPAADLRPIDGGAPTQPPASTPPAGMIAVAARSDTSPSVSDATPLLSNERPDTGRGHE